MRKIIWVMLFLAMGWGLYSCGPQVEEEHLLGEDLIDNSTSVKLLDTFRINTSTVILDSLRTSGYSSLLVGQYTDPIFGKVTATGFCKAGLGFAFELDKYAEFDSLVFITYFNEYYYGGDTTLQHSLSVHRLTEEVKGSEDDGQLYNVNRLSYEEQPLGSITFKPRPTKGEDLHIRLSDELGRELIELAKDHEEITSDSEEFEDFFPGVALVPGASDEATILGYKCQDTSMVIRLYYHNTNEMDVDRHHDFSLSGSSMKFTNFTSDRTGTNMESLTEQDEDLDSKLTDNCAYIQGGVGLLARIEIPYIKNLLKLGRECALLDATLEIYPVKGAFDDRKPLPETLNLYLSDKKNRIFGALVNPSTGATLSSIYHFDDEFEEEIRYTFDISGYIGQLLVADEDWDNSLVITMPIDQFATSVDRLVIGDHDNADFKLKLNVTYVVGE